MNSELLQEAIKNAKEIAGLIFKIDSMIALAKHKRNSSYYMRKERHPLILKRDGVCKGSVLAEIIRIAKILDDADVAMPKHIYIQGRMRVGDPPYIMKEGDYGLE